MTSRRLLACAGAVLALVARPASGGDAALARVERALAAARAGGPSTPGRGSLEGFATALEQQARAQRTEFEAVAARRLPEKARARLEATRQAWEAAQGRLPGMLRSGRVEEALALVERLRAASRRAPLSAGELKTRVPDLRAPALSLGGTTAVAPGGEAPIGTIAPEVRQRAEAFSGPIEAYEWVRNTIRPKLYHGFMKGPLQTLLESSGNDADTAGLLVALLRAKGIPARYVRGTVDLPASVAVAITGTASPRRALRAFESAGIPAEPLPSAGTINVIRVERVWVETYLPYANYRGALLDAHEKVWVPLDPGFKRLAPPEGLDLRGLGLEPDQVFEDFLAAVQGTTPLETYRARAGALLASQRPDVAYEEALARRDVVAQNLGLLPGTLPYAVVARAEVAYEPPEPLVHTARFVLESDGAPLLDATFPTTTLLGQRLTLSYVPLEESDEDVVREHGGLFATPPYLVEVRPVLKLGGVVLASGTQGAGLGVTLDFRIELTTPGGRDAVSNPVLAGNLTAIGLAAGQVTADEGRQDEAARVLARLAFHYLDRWNRSDDELASLLRVVPIRPSVSTCLVQSAVEVEYAGGDPLYPVRYDWKGLAIDADRRPSAPVGIESDAAERDFLLASGLEGSVLEHRLFEDDLGVASVSTVKALQLAGQAGVEVLDLDAGNAEALLAGAPLDESVKEEIRAGVAKGYRARVPASALSLLAWSGVGYLIFDHGTGESAWQLQGGHSGGVTAPAVVDLPANLVDVVRRQSETPSPRPGGVAFLQKFDTTDYQLGTVDTPLARPFKVLVTDEEGFPVPGAAVTFSVIGGGGLFVDPVTGRASASEITVSACAGGEEEEPCASLRPGEAVATLHLGRRTGEIPYYTCEAPFTCTCPPGEDDCDRDEVGYATQVGMNLVTASSGGVVLAQPFTAFGYPERPALESPPGAIRVYMQFGPPAAFNPVNLTVVDRMAMSVGDRHGNPISNVWVSAAYEGPPELGPAPPGGSLFREATDTPGHVLRARDYARCLETAPSIIWGECEGEDVSVVTRSSSVGAFVYPITGDSPWSYYKFNYGTVLNPTWSSVKYHTNGLSCPHPDPGQCAARDAPITFVWQGTRPVTINTLGNLVEAYPPGGAAEVGAWADVVYEEATVERHVGAGGVESFKALGTNAWKRERLLDSEFALAPLSDGTEVATGAAHVGQGLYTAPMTLSALPQLNSVEVKGKHYPPLVKYLGATGGAVDPATVDPDHLTLTRIKDVQRPIQITDRFDLWGVEARIKSVEPTPVLLSSGGVVTRPSFVNHELKPPEYVSLLTPSELRLEVRAAGDDELVLVASGAESTRFEIPAGLALPSGQYYGRVRVQGVSGAGADIASEPFPLPVCSLLDLETPVVRVHLTRDPLNGRACGSGDHLRFHLCRAARITLTVKGAPFSGSLDGGAPQVLTDIDLPAGPHSVLVPAGLLELESDEQVPFTLEARDAENPSPVAVAPGVIVSNVTNRSVLPVGHTFVKGVDLLDGHLVQQSTDLKVPGRHLGLELIRTYSSAGWNGDGPLGGGWSLNYGARLFADGACGLVTVVTPDGGSQVFQSDDGLGTFTPQKGYHTRLERDGSAYRFIDKAGHVHHFESPDRDGRPRLDYVEEPHGDRLVFTYDGASLLTRVAEVQPDAGEVRAVTFAYEPFNGAERVVRAEIASLGLAVDYEYDARGNLVKATRDGRNLGDGPPAEARVETYRYRGAGSAGATGLDLRREHQLVEVTDPNGSRREYTYFEDDDRLPGEVDGRLPAGGLLFTERWELVKQVVEHPDPALSIRTEFSYDAQEVLSRSQWRTTVRDARGADTSYVLNGNGSPLEIHEPLGKTTRMTWAPDDILKTSETDANGRVTELEYDGRGNLRLERILTADLGPVTTEYRYDTRFNKLEWKKDAEGRETTYTIDPDDGDLLETIDAEQNLTSYAYDEHGRLQTVTDPRLHATTHSNHDSFGNARTITDPLGNVTTREYDLRGRLRIQADTLGRRTSQDWDGLDRLIRTRRVAGPPSDDEVTETAYYPGGEVRQVTNANEAVTTYTIDGLSRVTATRTELDGTPPLTTATTYDGNGNKETETDRRGVTKRFVNDELNRLTAVEIVSGLPGEGPTGTIAEYGYDLVGNKKWEKNLAGLTTGFELDGLYRVTAKVLPENKPGTGDPYREEYRYDRVGNLRSQKDANGHETTWDYDGLDRRTRTTNALGQVTTETYLDPEGSHVSKSEEHDQVRGLRTTFRYDELNRETERTVHLEGEAGGGAAYTTTTAYDDANHSVTVTNPRLFATVTRLDGLDRPFEQTVDPGGLALLTRTSYDGLGNRKTLTDPKDHTTRYRHDGLGRLVETVDALIQSTVRTYDGEGLKTSETDRRGVTRTFAYDNLGRPRKTTLAPLAAMSGVPWSQETQYQDVARRRIEIDARGHATTYGLDALERVITVTDPPPFAGQTARTTWDGVNKREDSDRRGHTTKYEYDALNRLTRVTDPAPFADQTAETFYEDAENRRREKDRRGFIKLTQLDPLGRVVSITRALGTPDESRLETNTYDGVGNRESQTDAEGRVTRFAYDAANRLESRTDGFGTDDAATTTFVYDEAGNTLEERDARAAALGEPWSIKRTWDELNRLDTETDGEGNVTDYGYDPEGKRTSTKTPKGPETVTTYDELGKPLDVTQPKPSADAPANPVTHFRYDENRNLVRMEDADGRVTKLDYDELNRLFRTTRDPGGLNLVTETTEFDEDGHPLRIAEANGEVTRQTWDELGRLSTRKHEPPAGWAAPWAYTTEERRFYDANSNLERVEEHDVRKDGTTSPERVTTRGYDRLDRQTSETVTLQNETTSAVTTEYYRDGRVKAVTDPRGVTSYSYDGQGREETVTTSGGETRKTYYPDGLVKDITFPNLTKRAHGYDKADRLLSIVTTKDEAVVASTAYTYDPNGNRLTQVQTNGGSEEATSYTYDDLDRLATVTYAPDAGHPNGRKVAYGHDGAGNRKTEVVTDPQTEAVLESKTGHFDNANRLSELTDNLDPVQTTTLVWDKNGNLLSETKAGVTTTYRYDLRDTLAEVERGGQPLARFLGDFDERRVLKIGDPTRPGGSGAQEYVYNGSRLILDVENGQPVSRYEWTNQELVSLLENGGQRRYFALDGLETVLALTDEAGQATDRLNFDAWGVPREGTDFGTTGNRFAFTSHRFDTELDLYYAGGRMYSPTIGRFISQDTLSLDPNNPDTWNLFSYARANPTRYVDPTGHQTVDPDAAPDDVVGGEAALAAIKAEQARANAESADEPWNAAGSPGAATVTEEDNGPLGNLIMRPLRALGRTTPVQKAGQGIRWVFDQVDVFAKKMGIVARGVTREQAGRQDEAALREKFDLYRAFEGQAGTPGDEIAAKHIAVNTGREFVETSAEINQKVTEEGTRQGVPLAAGVVAKKGFRFAGEVAEDLAAAPSRGAPRSLLEDIVQSTNRVAVQGGEITEAQLGRLRQDLPVVARRGKLANRVMRREFERMEEYLIGQWEQHTGRAWPAGATPHHIIPLESGGANKWWNLAPTHGQLPTHSLPTTSGPHSSGSVLRQTIQRSRKALPPGTETDLRRPR